MMKKFFLLVLTFAYLASSTGATVYIHQCMGETIGWDLNIEQGNICSDCGMHKNAPQDCCKDQVKVLKTNSDQGLPVISLSKIALANVILSKIISPDFYRGFKNLKYNSSEFSLFPRSKINYCTLYCTFLI